MNVANAYFYVQVATWTCFMLAYTDYEELTSNDKVKIFDVANKFLPATVLIVSVLFFRCRFNGK